MSGLKIYGIPGSRALRSIWMAEELKQEIGLDYELVPIHFKDASSNADYLKINPNGRVPGMDDNGLHLFESMAINLYLAKKHANSALAPRDLTEDALATQWSVWGIAELEESIIALVLRHPAVNFAPPDKAIEDAAREKLQRPLKVLNAHLADRDWLIADRFTVADLNVASVLTLSQLVQLDLSPYPKVVDWFTRCMSRPALAAAQGA